MNYGIHRVSITEPDDYMDIEMLDDMTVSAVLQYVLSDPDAGILRIMDIDGKRLGSITAEEKNNREFYLFAKLISELPSGTTLIAGVPDDISKDSRTVSILYQECLKRGIRIVFRKAHYLDSENFTSELKDETRKTVLGIIDKLLALPIMQDEDVERRVMRQIPGSMKYSQDLKKTL